MAFGGAFSIDQEHRVPGFSWWEQELPTVAQQNRALDRGEVDILLTHDAPGDVCPIVRHDFKGDVQSTANRLWISHLIGSTKPEMVFHGHMHHRYSAFAQGARVEGLDCDGTQGKSFLIVNLDRIQNAGREREGS